MPQQQGLHKWSCPSWCARWCSWVLVRGGKKILSPSKCVHGFLSPKWMDVEGQENWWAESAGPLLNRTTGWWDVWREGTSWGYTGLLTFIVRVREWCHLQSWIDMHNNEVKEGLVRMRREEGAVPEYLIEPVTKCPVTQMHLLVTDRIIKPKFIKINK